MMKKLVLIAALALAPSLALAQTGVYPANTVWGNGTGSPAQPKVTPFSDFTGLFANPTATTGLTVVNGTATTAMRSDAAPPLSSGVQSSLTQTLNQVLLGTGAFGFSSVTAVNNAILQTNGSGVPSFVAGTLPTGFFANPTASIGLTAINGSNGTAMDSGSAPALDQSISPTWTGTHTFNNLITVTKGAGSDVGFQSWSMTGVRTFKWDIENNVQLSTEGTINALKLNSDDGSGIPWRITELGALVFGNPHTSYSGLSCPGTVSSEWCTTGPTAFALGVIGDIMAGDYGYFGATSTAGNEVQQIGVRAWGAYASATVIGAGWQGFAGNDSSATHCTNTSTQCGSGEIIIQPDDSNQTGSYLGAGSVSIYAHGSQGSGTQNEIGLYIRTGTNTNTLLASVKAISAWGSLVMENNAMFKFSPLDFASLPTCDSSHQGGTFLITNSNTATFNATITTTGSNIGLAVCNGTNWTFH